MLQKIEYASNISISVYENMLAIDCNGEAFCLDITNLEITEEAIAADLSVKHEGMVTITEQVCIINNFTNNLVYIDADGLRSESLNNKVFFKEE